MKKSARRRALVALTAIATLLATGGATAQGSYPTKPVTLLVAYPAGGDTDVLARLFAEKLAARLGQPVVVENRTGAGGTIGTAYVAKAAPDGYTLLFAPNTISISPHVLRPGTGASYDPRKDLTPITLLGTQSLFVVVNKAAGVTRIEDFVTHAKAGTLKTYGSPGNGSPMHILAELFNKSAGIKLTQIPYRGSAPAVVDLLGGQVPMMYSTLGPVSQYFPSGKLIPLAVADKKRSPFAPNVPSLAELGYKDVEVGAWQAVVGPKGMSPELVLTLNKHFNDILKMPDVVARMATVAVTPQGSDPAALGKLIAADYERYGRIVKEFGIQAD